MAKIMRNCRIETTRKGRALPAMISGDVARLARSRSHVFQPYSTKNAKAGHPHNVEAIDHGFTGHHLFGAIGTPVALGAEGEGEHGLEEGYERSGKTMRIMMGSGSRESRRNS